MSSTSAGPSLNGVPSHDPSTSAAGIAGAQSVEMVVEGERFLKAIKFVWEDHSASMKQLTQVLRYMVSFFFPLHVSASTTIWIHTLLTHHTTTLA